MTTPIQSRRQRPLSHRHTLTNTSAPPTVSSNPTSSSCFQPIFDAALSEYANKTGIDLATYPFAQSLQNCRTADTVLDLLQDKAKQFHAYRDGNRKLISCLKPVVQVLHSFSGFLTETTALVSTCGPIQPFLSIFSLQVPFPPSNAILVGVDVILAVCISPSLLTTPMLQYILVF